MAFARRQFELSAPQDDGKPLIAHLLLVQKQTGIEHEMLRTAPPLPAGLEELWRAFQRLHGNRGSTGWGPAKITDVDIVASRQAVGLVLQPWEVALVNRADDLWLSEFAPKPKADK